MLDRRRSAVNRSHVVPPCCWPRSSTGPTFSG